MYGNEDGDGSNLCGDGWGRKQGFAATVGDGFQVCGDGRGMGLVVPHAAL